MEFDEGQKNLVFSKPFSIMNLKTDMENLAKQIMISH